MQHRSIREGLICLILIFAGAAAVDARTQMARALVPKFELKKSGLELERRTQPGAFFDVIGRKSAALGYENRSLEAWVYPLKILDDFQLSFSVEGYPLEFRGDGVGARCPLHLSLQRFRVPASPSLHGVAWAASPASRVVRDARTPRRPRRAPLPSHGGST